MKTLQLLLAICISLNAIAQKKQAAPVMSASKKTIVENINGQASSLISISDKIWAAEETAFNEHTSAKLLADYAEANGFKVER
ncbi:MAG TPA: amidohydrolase, partial [Cyclobacteriaceae bacterium]|nr:amidohydrolase [Cyclobacteriaceae bacterium]